MIFYNNLFNPFTPFIPFTPVDNKIPIVAVPIFTLHK